MNGLPLAGSAAMIHGRKNVLEARKLDRVLGFARWFWMQAGALCRGVHLAASTLYSRCLA